MAACESSVFDIFVIALWISYVSAVRCFICFCHSSQLFSSYTTSNNKKRTTFSNWTSSPQMNTLSFFCKWRRSPAMGRCICFVVFISFGGRTLYIMAIGKRLGITQHVIWPGGSSCHFSLAVAGSHAKGCNMFLFSPLRTHVFFLLAALLFSPPAQPKSDQIHATSYCTKTLVRYSKGPPRSIYANIYI